MRKTSCERETLLLCKLPHVKQHKVSTVLRIAVWHFIQLHLVNLQFTHTATLCSMKNVRKTKQKSVTHIDFHRRMFQEQSLLTFSAPENMSQQKKFTNHFENKGIDQCRDLCLCVEISNIIQEQYLSHSTSTSFSSSSSSSLSSSSSFSSVTSSPPTCDVCSLP